MGKSIPSLYLIRPIIRAFSTFFASTESKKPSEGPKTPKKHYLSDFGSFRKKRFFRFLAPLAPSENTIITVFLAILANFTILEIAYTNSH